jgi:hypothetical protein
VDEEHDVAKGKKMAYGWGLIIVMFRSSSCSWFGSHYRFCATRVQLESIEEELAYIESHIDGAAFAAVRAGEFLKQLRRFETDVLLMLHPRHMLLARLYKVKSDVLAVLIAKADAEVAGSYLLEFFVCALELKKSQTHYLTGHEHIDCGRVWKDLSFTLGTLVEQNPEFLLTECRMFESLQQAKDCVAYFTTHFERCAALYKDVR